MKVQRILIYGSSFMTEAVLQKLHGHVEIVGIVPNRESYAFNCEDLVRQDVHPYYPVLTQDEITDDMYDIAISIQYDQIIKNINRAFNLHTGLLPEWGGAGILHHTLESGTSLQGLTLHTMTDQLDTGKIIVQCSYPVYDDDEIVDLYLKALGEAPDLLVRGLAYIITATEEQIDKLTTVCPTLYRRKDIPKDLQEEYIRKILLTMKIRREDYERRRLSGT